MEGRSGLDELRDQVAAAEVVVPTGAQTQWEVGGPPPTGTAVRAPSGVVRYEPADLTVTVGAGTPVADLDAALAAEGQECPLDPRDGMATVGGLLACGLSGRRRLRFGPVRDRVLEVRVVSGAGRLVKGGGPTVKNVSGYDLPRLFVGSFGTLGVIGQVTLRCQPRPRVAAWISGEAEPFAIRRALARPSCIAWDGRRVWCLLEGDPSDVAADAATSGLTEADAPPWTDGPWRGRISIRPREVAPLGRALSAILGLRWLAEVGVGTVHVAADAPEAIEAARLVAGDLGGWLLREAGAGLDGFGRGLPNIGITRRLKDALDPSGRCNPGRLPL